MSDNVSLSLSVCIWHKSVLFVQFFIFFFLFTILFINIILLFWMCIVRMCSPSLYVCVFFPFIICYRWCFAHSFFFSMLWYYYSIAATDNWTGNLTKYCNYFLIRNNANPTLTHLVHARRQCVYLFILWYSQLKSYITITVGMRHEQIHKRDINHCRIVSCFVWVNREEEKKHSFGSLCFAVVCQHCYSIVIQAWIIWSNSLVSIVCSFFYFFVISFYLYSF